MKKKTVVSLLATVVLFLLVGTLSGCGQHELVGTWEYDTIRYEFVSDGTFYWWEYNNRNNNWESIRYSQGEWSGAWSTNGNLLTLTTGFWGQTGNATFTFNRSGNTLTLNMEEIEPDTIPLVLTRVR